MDGKLRRARPNMGFDKRVLTPQRGEPARGRVRAVEPHNAGDPLRQMADFQRHGHRFEDQRITPLRERGLAAYRIDAIAPQLVERQIEALAEDRGAVEPEHRTAGFGEHVGDKNRLPGIATDLDPDIRRVILEAEAPVRAPGEAPPQPRPSALAQAEIVNDEAMTARQPAPLGAAKELIEAAPIALVGRREDYGG